jgi:hypothetical protein
MRRICPSGARSIHSRANAGDRGKVADHGGVRREVRAVGPRVGTNDIGIDCLNPSGTDWWSACVMDPDLPICPDCSGKLKLGLSIARFIERPDIRIRRPCPCCTHRLHPPIEPPLGPTRQSGRRKKLLPRHHFHDPPPTVVQRIGLRQPIAAFSWLALCGPRQSPRRPVGPIFAK